MLVDVDPEGTAPPKKKRTGIKPAKRPNAKKGLGIPPEEMAQSRLNRGRGRPPDQPLSAVVPLPFEATLAFAFRSLGGKITAIEGARIVAETDTRYAAFVKAYETLGAREKEGVKLEDLCSVADIKPADFLGAVYSALWQRNVDIGKLTIAMNHPRIIEATQQFAMTGQFNSNDRKMMLDAVGVLPLPKGQTIMIDNSKKTVNVDGGAAQIEARETGPGLPSFEEDRTEVIRSVRGDAGLTQKALPPATPSQAVPVPTEPEVIEAELVQPEDNSNSN